MPCGLLKAGAWDSSGNRRYSKGCIPDATAEAAVAAIVASSSCRIVAHFVTTAEWAGNNTLVPPMLIWISFVTVMKLTRTVEICGSS